MVSVRRSLEVVVPGHHGDDRADPLFLDGVVEERTWSSPSMAQRDVVMPRIKMGLCRFCISGVLFNA